MRVGDDGTPGGNDKLASPSLTGFPSSGIPGEGVPSIDNVGDRLAILRVSDVMI